MIARQSVAPEPVITDPPGLCEAVPAMPDTNRNGISESTRQMWAERVASRWNDLRARRDAELHCRAAYALHRFTVPYVELPSHLQNVINQDVNAVLNNFVARMTDNDFDYLSHDRRAKLEPEVGTAVQR